MVVAVVEGFGATVSDTLALPGQLLWSVAVTVKGNVPVAVGVPESRPELELMFSPDGAPLVAHVSGVTPLEAENCCINATPIVASVKVPAGDTVIVGQPAV
jgi:hypothetical protein